MVRYIYIYMYVQTSKLKLLYIYLYFVTYIIITQYSVNITSQNKEQIDNIVFIQIITAVRLILHMQVDDGGEAQSAGIHCKQTSLLETISPGLGTCGTWDRKNRSCESSEGGVGGDGVYL